MVRADSRAGRSRTPAPHGKLDTADDISKVNELHVQVDTLYHYKLESKVVLHNFSVPGSGSRRDSPDACSPAGSSAPDANDIQCAEYLRHRRADGRAHLHREPRAARHLDQSQAPRYRSRPPTAPPEAEELTRRDRTAVTDAAHAAQHHGEASFWSRYVFSTDHKVIAMTFTGMAMALIGGFMACTAFRMQLAFPGIEVPGFGMVSPADYNSLVTNHGSDHDLLVAMPGVIAACLGNYLIPPTSAATTWFRRAEGSYQVFLLSACRAAGVSSRRGRLRRRLDRLRRCRPTAPTACTPLGSSMWLTAVALEFVAFLMGGINFVTTPTMNSRAPRHEDVRHPDRRVDDRDREHLDGVGGPASAPSCSSWTRTYSTIRRAAGPLAAPVLVLRPPGGVRRALPAISASWRAHHHGLRRRKKLFAYRTAPWRHRRRRSSPSGPTTSSSRAGQRSRAWPTSSPSPRRPLGAHRRDVLFVYIATLYGGSITLATPMLSGPSPSSPNS